MSESTQHLRGFLRTRRYVKAAGCHCGCDLVRTPGDGAYKCEGCGRSPQHCACPSLGRQGVAHG
jgi:hypothetical protein